MVRARDKAGRVRGVHPPARPLDARSGRPPPSIRACSSASSRDRMRSIRHRPGCPPRVRVVPQVLRLRYQHSGNERGASCCVPGRDLGALGRSLCL